MLGLISMQLREIASRLSDWDATIQMPDGREFSALTTVDGKEFVSQEREKKEEDEDE